MQILNEFTTPEWLAIGISFTWLVVEIVKTWSGNDDHNL